MANKHFDPFNDRLARDIRNALGKAFVSGSGTLDPSAARQAAAIFVTPELAPHHREYIDDHLHRYEAVYAAIQEHQAQDPFRQALYLWDHGLFFEFHEVVEELWLQAREGPQKLALQAMIRAAGVYIHLAEGHCEAAQSMAAKAAAALAAHRSALPVSIDCPALISALERLDPVPPKLAGR